MATLLGGRARSEGGYDFRRALRDQQAAIDASGEDGAPGSFVEWSDRIPVPQVGPLRVDDFPFQREWYSEAVVNAEEVAMMKSSQIGASEYFWRWGTYRADRFGDTCVYSFPSADHVREFGDTRIEPAIEESAYLRMRIKAKWVKHKTLKRIGSGWLVLRGTKSKAGAQSTAAQALAFDEYDLLDPDNRAQMERRVRGARQLGKRPRVRRFGNPTIPGFGIDAVFATSDQRKWLVTCEECGHEQEVTWESNVRWRNVEGGPVQRPGFDEYEPQTRDQVFEAWRQCSRCEERLDVKQGRWVAQRPGARVIGYHVTQLIVPNADLRAIVVSSRTTNPGELEAFFNNDLGVPYSPSEASLSQEDLLNACQRGGEMLHGYVGPLPVTMGLDVAGTRDLNARIDVQLPSEYSGVPNPRQAVWIGQVKDFKEAARLIEAFNVTLCAIDANPERRAARGLQATFPGRVVLVEYDPKNDSDPIVLKEQSDENHPTLPPGVPLRVRVNQVEAMDAMMDSIRQLRNRPLREPPHGWLEQMRAPKRRTVATPSGGKRRVYVSTGADDYAHADVYALVATEMWRARQGVEAVHGQEREQHLPDEEFGFRRVSLVGGTDDYDPRLGRLG